jgi:hypothetical protein
MLFRFVVLIWTALIIGWASASSQQCQVRSLGKYAPLTRKHESAQKYCAALLKGKSIKTINAPTR